jgi:hypothetical protein
MCLPSEEERKARREEEKKLKPIRQQLHKLSDNELLAWREEQKGGTYGYMAANQVWYVRVHGGESSSATATEPA